MWSVPTEHSQRILSRQHHKNPSLALVYRRHAYFRFVGTVEGTNRRCLIELHIHEDNFAFCIPQAHQNFQPMRRFDFACQAIGYRIHCIIIEQSAPVRHLVVAGHHRVSVATLQYFDQWCKRSALLAIARCRICFCFSSFSYSQAAFKRRTFRHELIQQHCLGRRAQKRRTVDHVWKELQSPSYLSLTQTSHKHTDGAYSSCSVIASNSDRLFDSRATCRVYAAIACTYLLLAI